MIQTLLRIKVNKEKELKRNNIKWHKGFQHKRLRDSLFSYVQQWKDTNVELLQMERTRDDEALTMGNIKESVKKVSDEVCKIFEILDDAKIKRRLNVQGSVISSQEEINKIVALKTKSIFEGRTRLQKHNTQFTRQGSKWGLV